MINHIVFYLHVFLQQVDELTELQEFIAPVHNNVQVAKETEAYIPMRPAIDWINWERIGEQVSNTNNCKAILFSIILLLI